MDRYNHIELQLQSTPDVARVPRAALQHDGLHNLSDDNLNNK